MRGGAVYMGVSSLSISVAISPIRGDGDGDDDGILEPHKRYLRRKSI